MTIFHIIGTVSFIHLFREHSVCCISQMPNEKRNTESRKIDCPAFATITEIIRWVKPNVSDYTYICLPIPLCHKINGHSLPTLHRKYLSEHKIAIFGTCVSLWRCTYLYFIGQTTKLFGI